MDESEVDLLSGVMRTTEHTMAGVDPEQLHDPTPCPDYDVARLLDHLVGWARSFAARVSGAPEDGDPNDYRAAGDPAAEFHEAARTLITGLRGDEAAAQRLPVAIVLPEFLAHSWDLARATGQELVVDPAAAELALGSLRSMLKPEYRGPDQSFGPEVPVDPAAPAIDRLVGFVGRDPAWAPASCTDHGRW